MGIASALRAIRATIVGTVPITWTDRGFTMPPEALGTEPHSWIEVPHRQTRDCHLAVEELPSLASDYCRHIVRLTLSVVYRLDAPRDLVLIAMLEDAASLTRALAINPAAAGASVDVLLLEPGTIESYSTDDDRPLYDVASMPMVIHYRED